MSTEQDERQGKFDKFLPTLDSFIQAINNHTTDAYDKVRELAQIMEQNGFPKSMIAGSIKGRIRKINEEIEKENKKKKLQEPGATLDPLLIISDSMIDRALSKEYKDQTKVRKPREKVTEESTSQLQVNEPTIDDKKVIEEPEQKEPITVATTGESIISEEDFYNDPDNFGITYEEYKREIVPAATKPNVDPTTPEGERTLEQQVSNRPDEIKAYETRIKNLEDHIKILQQQKGKFHYPSTPLEIDDKLEYQYSTPLNRMEASWVASKIMEFLNKYPKNNYFLVQCNGAGSGKVRVNIIKQQFLT